ncbi:hypothetical protein DRO91_07400, partial [Candidatus Heimdallarchaeota archaeon]
MKLDQKYNREHFVNFLKEVFLKDYQGDIRPVSTSGFKAINKAFSLGRSESLDLQVFEFEYSGSFNKRITLAKEAFQAMKQRAIFHALAIFHSPKHDDWRLSLMTANPQRTEKGKVTLAYSNPKRYSFFLGPNAKINTPTKFLLKKESVRDFDDLKERFSLEVVNKEFYQAISESFIKLVGGTLGSGKKAKTYKPVLKLPSVSDHSQTSLEFAVRLIGRIIFCWFLREKKGSGGTSLMPKELLSLDAIGHNPDYYHQILEPIFFEILNQPIKSRKDPFYEQPYSSIPYLNGGLFSPHTDDFYKRKNGDLQSKFYNTLIIPNEWFVEFFEILETYNFTIDENTSFDEELSIDPEMLGRIFENLLAEINPETGESARKNTGSYYTPRIIVDYMVDESLLLYLKQQTKIDENKLKVLISYDLTDDEQYPLESQEKEKIVNALEKVKILDPACGSGAFPIGMLQKIVFILDQIDPHGELWFKKQLKNISPELKRKLEQEHQDKNYDYIRKLGVIRENIYGVDIQSIATEISRLRCFLTLMVDQSIHDKENNRGVEPLPNLDFKFVTANTLIGLPNIDNSGQTGLFDDTEKIDDLKYIRDQYFNASGIEREQLKTEFVTAQKRLVDQLIKEHGFMGVAKAELTQKLTNWEPFSHKMTSWFDPEWMFGIKDGFDIVIANPPYIDSEGMVKNGLEELRAYISKNYKYTKGNWDIYIAFFEKGLGWLKQNGILTYISPDKWISKPFGKELRVSTLKYVYAILNAGRHVFESANVDSIVTIFEKKENNDIRILKIKGEKSIFFIRTFSKRKIKPPYALDFLFSNHLELLEKIEQHADSKLLTLNCENACATSDAYKLAPLLSDLPEEKFDSKKYLKIINTGTIGKYVSKWGFRQMTYLGNKYQFPGVPKKRFATEFHNSYSQKSIMPKIIIKGLNLLDACLDKEGIIIPGKSTLMIADENIKNLKFLLAFINCPLPIFYLKEKYPASSYNQGTSFTKDMINNLPIP